MRRSWIRGSLFLPLIPMAVTVTTGVAHLASIDVPVTYADQIRTQVSVPTTLSVGPNAQINVAEVVSKGLYHFVGVVGRLRVGGLPVEGESLIFTASGVQICTAVTDGTGRARCNVKVDTSKFSARPTTFTASFGGDGDLQAADSPPGGLTAVG
jgi:hypothetical protein